MSTDTLILIPARMAASRLPDKPLAMIGDAPMIVHVRRRAAEAEIGRVVVACDDQRIAEAIEQDGGEAVLTRADHPSGSDRIHEALQRLDPNRQVDFVINLQGDLPLIEPAPIKACRSLLSDADVAISTVALEITDERERTDPNVVKVVGSPIGEDHLRALYFTRATAPYGDGPHYHHIGIYGYRRAALERFVSLPPSPLERREKLEQLRALEAGMRIDVGVVKTVPVPVDTPEDLERARQMMISYDAGR